jgi:hypothetical protein
MLKERRFMQCTGFRLAMFVSVAETIPLLDDVEGPKEAKRVC